MRPIIGLLAAVDNDGTTTLFHPYARAIEQSGGVPLLLPYTESADVIARFVAMCDGFLFTGGVDIDPAYYHEAVSETCGEIQPLRDRMELAAFEQAFRTGKPLLGICRGAQLFNVALGGTLYQDIPSECPSGIPHRQTEEKFEFSHDILVRDGTPLSALVGVDRMRGNSFHHQAIKALGSSFRVMAEAEDGMIEAIWLPDHPYLRAYQWHPERICEKDESNRAIFEDFIRATTT